MNTRCTAAFVGLFIAASGCATVETLPESSYQVKVGEAQHIVEEDFVAYTISTSIQASPDVVWQLLTEAQAYTTWNSTIISLDGEIAEGEKIELLAKVSPDRAFKLKVSQLEPSKKMVWEDGMPFGLFKGVRTFSLQATADGQGTEFLMSEVFSGPMHGAITGSIPDLRPSFQDFANDLKTAAEKQ